MKGGAWGIVCVTALSVVAPHCACAQGLSGKPLRVLVGFAAGGATDVSARMLGQKLSDLLGQPIIVENRPGSGGLLATEAVARAPADGQTLLMMAAADTVQPALRAKMPYDLLRDFTPISLVVTGPFVLAVHPSVPARTVKELIEVARKADGRMNYATSGLGSSAHMAAELFNSLTKIKSQHVPYKGVSQGVIGVANGEADLIFASIPSAKPMLEIGKLRMLAITPAKRSALTPGVPTISEAGVPGYDRTGWYGVIGPAGIPGDLVSRLNTAIARAVSTPELKSAFFKQGLEVETLSPVDFGKLIHREVMQNIAVAKAAGIKPE